MSFNNKNKSILPSISKESLDILPFGVYIINKKGIVEFLNTKMAKISGVKEVKKIEGQNVFEIPTYKKYGLIKYIKQGLSGKPFRVEGLKYISYVGKKESIRSYYGIPIKNKKGAVVKLLCIIEDITRKKRNEIIIKNALREKEVLLKEIHHRIKNNMQIIYSLLNLQSHNIKDKGALELIKESQNQIRSMLMIHEDLYQSDNLAKIDFNNYVNNFIINLFDVYRIDRTLIKKQINIKKIFLKINLAIPCALIINELVSNSLKYAFPNGRKGKIFIKLSKVNKIYYELVVGDNGVGLPKNINFKKKNSLGLNLVSTLIKQIYGKLEIKRNKGTRFIIKFPKNI